MKASLMIVRALGAILLLLGLAIWVKVADALTPVHMALGVVLVAALLFAAFRAVRAGVPTRLAAVAAVWALVTLGFGLVQRSIAPVDGHIVVQLIHLAIGLGAIGIAEALGGAAKRVAA